MKSKFPPLALGAVTAACIGALGLAYWTLASDEAPVLVEAGLPGDSLVLAGAKSAQPLALDAKESSTAVDARVALADESAVRALPQVEFELRASPELPLAGARALLFRKDELLGSGECDSAGVVHFDAGEGHASLLIVAKHVPALTREVPLSAGRQLLVFERGVAVSGRVRSIDRSSIEGVMLQLTSDRALVDESNWPEAVRRELKLDDQDKLRLEARTNAAGEFEFIGLGSPWSGKLATGETHELLAVSGVEWTRGADSIRLDDPLEGLVLDVAAWPMARGRVVLSPAGPGVAKAKINAQLAFEPPFGEDENSTAEFSGRTQDDGGFVLPIHRPGTFDSFDQANQQTWPALERATLTIDGVDNLPRQRLEISADQLSGGFDFGELVLVRGSTLQFTALDTESNPLVGALGRLDGERSEPTDGAGRASLAYAPGVRRALVVSLAGYREGRVEVPAEVSDVLQVVLRRTNRLSVVVRGPGDIPVVDVNVQVTSQAPQGQRLKQKRNRSSERTDGQGRATFSDLTPAMSLQVEVRDAAGAVVTESSLTLDAEEWREIQITVLHPLLAFAGVVRDELGLALAGASVEFSDAAIKGGRSNVSTRSDADGRFSFSGLNNPLGTLRLRKAGFAPVTLVDFQFPPPGVIADIRMERGMRLTLRIVDQRGAPVHGDNLRLELPGERPFTGRRDVDNAWTFSNLPRAGMTAICVVGSREYRQEIEPLNGDQDFRVPVQGGLEIALRLDPTLLQSQLRLTLRARDDKRVTLTRSLAQETFQIQRFQPLLPAEYLLTLARLEPDERGGSWVNYGAPKRVTIQAGESQRLELER